MFVTKNDIERGVSVIDLQGIQVLSRSHLDDRSSRSEHITLRLKLLLLLLLSLSLSSSLLLLLL